MSRIRNADDFRFEFGQARGEYDRLFGPTVRKLRERLDQLDPGDSRKAELQAELDENLEVHIRAYVVNALLAALNWRMGKSLKDGLPNLVPEAAVRSAERNTRRFMDYLGVERDTQLPLLVVEVKRPSAPLPIPRGAAAGYDKALVAGLQGEHLPYDWDKWLGDVRDYVVSVHASTGNVPRRVAITNGEWLVVFLDPAKAFTDPASPDPNAVRVLSSREQIERDAHDVFEWLCYDRVLAERAVLRPVQVKFRIRPGDVRTATHALHVHYEAVERIDRPKPYISVAPAIVLCCQNGYWMRVEANGSNFTVPDDPARLARHIEEVDEEATRLMVELAQHLGQKPPLRALPDHYADEDFDSLPGVRRVGNDRYLLVTGEGTHYLRALPGDVDCPYHDAAKCEAEGFLREPGHIKTARIKPPRCFFPSGSAYHCAHGDVLDQKREPISECNRDRCGTRSAKNGEAFCEIYAFESFLCCRACAYESVCSVSRLLRLPCRRGQVTAGQ